MTGYGAPGAWLPPQNGERVAWYRGDRTRVQTGVVVGIERGGKYYAEKFGPLVRVECPDDSCACHGTWEGNRDYKHSLNVSQLVLAPAEPQSVDVALFDFEDRATE